MSLQPKDWLNQGDNGVHFPNHVLNQLLNQSRNQLGGMSTHGGANYVSGNHTGPNNNLLAAAVQQQLMASLVSSNFQLLQPQAGQRLANGCPNRSGLNTMPLSGREAMDSQRPQSVRVQEGSVGSTRKVATTQIPCQARGMSTDHNSLTAYFEILDTATHGQHLYCSHPTCRAVGVKFRYCLHCKKPVTKQNFRSRHLHADLEKTSSTFKSPGVGAGMNKNQQNKTVRPVVSQIGTTFSVTPLQTRALRDIHPEPAKGGRMGLTKKRKGDSSPSPPAFDPALVVVARRRRWSSLLRERPLDLSTINRWLSKVISVSDPKAPISFTEESLLNRVASLVEVSVKQQSLWDELLEQRPEDVGSDSTEWLLKVLSISSPGFDLAARGKAADSFIGETSGVISNLGIISFRETNCGASSDPNISSSDLASAKRAKSS